MTKLNIWSRTKKWFVKILIALGIIGVAIGVGLPTDKPVIVDVNGEQISFPYTDGKSDIYTDREIYGGWNGSDMYLAIDSEKNQMIDLQMFFGNESRKMTDLSRLIQDVEYTYESPIYEEVCEDVDVSSSTSATSTKEVCHQEQSGTETLTATKDIWSPVSLTPFSKIDRLKKLSSKGITSDIRNFTAKKKGTIHLTKGLNYFKAYIEFPRNVEGEFFIEAIGKDTYKILDPWYNSSWLYKKKITIASSSVDGSLTEYPVYLDLSDFGADFHSNVKDDFSDIRITSSTEDGVLYHELVSASTTAETGEMYFNSVALSSSTDNDFYIYYGNAAASDVSTSSVWNSNYGGVWHLQQDPAGTAPQMIDSTNNGNDGTSNGSMTSGDSVAGKIGNALELDGSNDYINIPNDTSINEGTSDLTVIAWFNSNSFIDAGRIWNKGGAKRYTILYAAPPKDEFHFTVDDDSIKSIVKISATDLDDGTWHRIVAVRDYNNLVKIKIDDGTFSTASDGTGDISNIEDAQIGTNTFYSTAFYGGKLDALRVLNTKLSEDWLTTEHNNQNSPSTFYSVGSQEEPPSVGTNMQLNISDSWENIDAIQINIGDTWKDVEGAQENIGDSWKILF